MVSSLTAKTKRETTIGYILIMAVNTWGALNVADISLEALKCFISNPHCSPMSF